MKTSEATTAKVVVTVEMLKALVAQLEAAEVPADEALEVAIDYTTELPRLTVESDGIEMETLGGEIE